MTLNSPSVSSQIHVLIRRKYMLKEKKKDMKEIVMKGVYSSSSSMKVVLYIDVLLCMKFTVLRHYFW